MKFSTIIPKKSHNMKLHQKRRYLKFKEEYKLNKLASFCYCESKKKGFHNEEKNCEELNISKYLMNLHSEISELWESYRANNLYEDCNKADGMEKIGLDRLNCLEEELADILIRTCDMAKAFNIDLTRAVYIKLMYNRTRSHRNGGKLA